MFSELLDFIDVKALNCSVFLCHPLGKSLGLPRTRRVNKQGKAMYAKEAFPSVYSVELQYAVKLTMTAAIDQGPTMVKHCDKPLT